MGKLRSSIDQFKTSVNDWVSKVLDRGPRDIHQPLMRNNNPSASPEAYKLYADYQERIHELNLLIAWLQRAVVQAQQDVGAMAGGGTKNGMLSLRPIRPQDVRMPGPPLDAVERPLGVRLEPIRNACGGTEHIPRIDPTTLSVSSPMYKAVVDLIQQRAAQQARLAALQAGPGVTLD